MSSKKNQTIEAIQDYYNVFKNHYNKKYRHIIISDNDKNKMNELNISFTILISDYLKENKIDDNILKSLIELIDLKLKHHEILFESTDVINIISDSKSVIKCYKYLKTFIIVMIKT
jgi:hypothetical protein